MCSPFIVWLCLLTRATKRFDRVGFFFHFWAAAHLQTCQLEITIIVIISNSRKKGGGASKIHLWDLIQFPQLPALLGKFSKILHKKCSISSSSNFWSRYILFSFSIIFKKFQQILVILCFYSVWVEIAFHPMLLWCKWPPGLSSHSFPSGSALGIPLNNLA